MQYSNSSSSSSSSSDCLALGLGIDDEDDWGGAEPLPVPDVVDYRTTISSRNIQAL